MIGGVFGGIILLLIIITLLKTARVVPNKEAYIVERLGKYSRTLEAGFHILFPWIDVIRYKHTLKEEAIDVPSQICITKDNIQVEVDGVLYVKVIDPYKASYGIDNYKYATIQLAQTTMRSEMGKLDLDKTFEEREAINAGILKVLDEATIPWGVKVTRYEIKNISPPQSIKDAMEKQMRAEREKRALIAESEGERQAKINRAEGDKQEAIQKSEGEKMKRINEAEGRAQEILKVAQATAEGIKIIAQAISVEKGSEAVSLKIAEQYIAEFGKLAKTNNTMIIPSNLSDIGSIVSSLTKILNGINISQK
ncbi:MAG TPA: stomatin-like protein [bacterium]|nr:stomatin-like protein [bacterium]HOL47140.1 stomatin-like protein [bacterium]HPQ17929.1 stomatin-like protein [bacterium]